MRNKSLTDTIVKNKIKVFGSAAKLSNNKKNNHIATLKSNCSLFARMYISCQSRNGDFDQFYIHENHCSPPSLTNMGEMRKGKSDLLVCLQSSKPNQVVLSDAPKVDAEILDGASVVHMVPVV